MWLNGHPHAPLALAAALALTTSLLAACGDDTQACAGADCNSGGQGGEGQRTIQQACPKNGVLHGPWVIHFHETGALVRWDNCTENASDIELVPVAGGATQTFSGSQRAANVTTTYDVLTGVPADLPGVYYLSEVVLTGLQPSSCYNYTLVADSSRGGRFCTARKPGDGFKFLAIGDTNPAIGDTKGVLNEVLEPDIDFTIHLGDIQYYDSVFESWSSWFTAMAPLLRHGAIMPSIGNHEYEKDFEFQDYYRRLFGGAGFDGSVEYYRFQSGGVWFFSLSTEMDLTPGSEQANWLEAQLADAAAKPGFRFSVVYFHKPMITLSDYAQKKAERDYFAPIFETNKVRLVMQGHVHGYERFVAGNITYVVSGGGGATLYDLDVNIDTRPAEAALRQASASRYHATIIAVTTSGIEGRAIANDGALLDSFTITAP